MNESRQNDGQIQTVVFVLLLIAALVALVVGGSIGSRPTTTADKATVEVPTTVVEAPVAEATTEATTEATVEAPAETLGQVVAEVTPEATTEATVEAPAETLGQVVAEVTPEATTEATIETLGAAVSDAVAAPAPVQRVYFASPADGATVPTTFTVEMGAEGLTVEPAGDVHTNAGHFHILIDAPFVEPGEVIPKDDTHLHFGQAQSSAELTLTPGDHVLRLQFADGAHTALEGDQYRAEITVHVG
jgi:hypothetical protein